MNKNNYFDYAATTPVDKRVLAEMLPYFSQEFGNPSSVHSFGQKAQAAVDISRKKIADLFGVDFSGVVFTASATQANNLIIRGVVKATPRTTRKVPHIITSMIEHESVLETCRDLERCKQAEVTYLAVGSDGLIDLEQLKNSLKKETVLVSLMYVNNETGIIQPIQEIAEIVKEYRQAKLEPHNQARFSIQDLQYPFFHSDGAQAVNYVSPIKLDKLGVDSLTISSHKVYGPKGIAALVSNTPYTKYNLLSPTITGGGQEFGLFSGTENVAGIVGFGQALEISLKEKPQEQKRLLALKQKLTGGIMEKFPAAVFNPSTEFRTSGAESQVGNILNISFPGADKEELVYAFDKLGIAVSAGSACQAKALQDSHVLIAMGLDERVRSSAIRISLGRFTTRAEIDGLLLSLPDILALAGL